MYLLDVSLHNLACLAKKGMLLIQERLLFISLWEALLLRLFSVTISAQFTETVQLLARDFIEIVF